MGPTAPPSVILRIATELPPGLPGEENLGERLEAALAVILEREPRWEGRPVELSVVLTNESDIRALNREHRQVDAPTDVLSFPLAGKNDAGAAGESLSPSDGPPLALGDLVLCPQTISRQAIDGGLAVHERFAECLVHGVLHLLGHEHSTRENRKRMEALEDELVPLVTPLVDPGTG